MPTLSFAIEADYGKVIKLQEECARLRQELINLGNNGAPEKIKELEESLSSAQKEMGELIDKSAKAGAAVDSSANGMSGAMKKVGKYMAAAFALDKIKDFISQVISVRSEFQKLDIAFSTMLGSKEKADALMGQLVQLAATTPFGLSDVTSGAKQLIAFGENAETAADTLRRLGDIAAGTGAQVGQLTLVYGQVMAAGKLNGGDLIQFINAGVPIIKALADTMGVAESSVKGLISEGKVGFPEVQKAMKSLTDEGGTFANMMEKQSHTLGGRISSIEDNIEQMFNDIGQASEGALGAGISVVETIVENYDKVGRALVGLIATYGTYKAAVIAVAAAEKAGSIVKLAHAAATKVATGAQAAFNVIANANPYVLLATSLIAVISALWAFADHTSAAEKEQERLNDEMEANERIIADLKKKMDEYLAVIEDETQSETARIAAFTELSILIPGFKDKYASYVDVVRQSADAHRDEANAIRDRNNALQLKTFQETKGLLKLYDRAHETAKAYVNASKKDKERLYKEAKEAEREAYRAYLKANNLTGNIQIKKEFTAWLKDKDARTALVNSVNQQMSSRREQLQSDWANRVDGMSTKQLQSELAKVNKMKKAMQTQNKQYVQIGEDVLTMANIQTRIDALTEKISTRQKDNAADYVTRAKKEWEEAEKEVKDLIANRNKKDNNGDKVYSEQEYEKKLEELRETASSAKKRYEAYSGSSDKGGKSNGKSDAERLANEHAKREQAIKDYYASLEAQEKQLRTELNENNISLLDEGFAKELATINQNYDKLIQANAKREKEMLEAYAGNKLNEYLQANPNATEAQKNEFRNSTLASADRNSLTEVQQNILKEFDNLAQQSRDQAIDTLFDSQNDAYLQLLKDYGSYQEQKLAIAEEYAELIAQAEKKGDTWEVQKLKEQQKRDEASIEANAVKTRIDWYSVFSNLRGVFNEAMKPMLQDLEKFTQTQEFDSLNADAQKEITDAIDKIREQNGYMREFNWDDVAKAVTEYQEAVIRATEAQEAYAKNAEGLQSSITEAKDNLKQAYTTGDAEAIKRAQEELDNLRMQLHSFGQAVEEANDNVKKSANKVTRTTQSAEAQGSITSFLDTAQLGTIGELWKRFDKLSNILHNLIANGENLGKVGELVSDALDKITGKNENVAKALEKMFGESGVVYAQLIAAVLQVFDILKEGVGSIVADLADTIIGGIAGFLDNLASGKFLEQIGVALYENIGNLFKSFNGKLVSTLSFGALSSDPGKWFTNSNAEKVAKTTERLTKQNEHLEHSISQLKESIDNAYGSKAISDYQKAKEAQERHTENQRAILNAQMGYHNSHKSNAHYWNISRAMTDQVNELLGTTLRGGAWNDWSELTAEQFNEIRTYLPEVWSSMLKQGKYNKDEYLEAYADEAGKVQELTDHIRQNLFNTSFDGLRDSFISTLMDMNSSAEDFSNDLSEKLQRALLQASISNKFDKRIKQWYEDITDDMQDDDGNYKELTKDQINSYREVWDNMTAEMIAERDRLAKLTGVNIGNSSQSASAASVTQISEDTALSVVGRMTAINESQLRQEANVLSMNTNLQSISGATVGIRDIAGGIRDTLERSYIELQQINENTSAIVLPIRQMQADIARVKTNTDKL